jgi:hypothetical protein|tara:strand:- start:33 stop:329 length:297 start_codon:yes stop_codon:yes gene_type:complete
MKFFKISFLFLSIIFLNGCIQTTALIGPGITVATTGNMMQAGLQYGANSAIKKETGKNTFEHLKGAVESNDQQKKFILKFTKMIKQKFEIVKNKVSTN